MLGRTSEGTGIGLLSFIKLPSQSPRSPGRIFSLPSIISLGLAFLLLFFLLTRFDIDLKATWQDVKGSNPWLYFTGFLLYYVSFLFRGWRWRILARNAALHEAPGARLPSTLECAFLVLLGWFANTVSWFRLGDAYRAYAFSEAANTSLSRTLGTVVAERVIDMAAVFLLMVSAVLYLLVAGQSGPPALFLALALGMALVGGAVLLVMARFGLRLARSLPAFWREAYSRFHEGTLRSFKQMPLLLALSLVGWLLEMARLLFVLKALGLSVGVPMVLFVALTHSLLTAVPITPGGVGIVEPGVVGLLMLTLSREEAVSATLLDRSIAYLSVVVLGGLAFAVRHVVRSRSGPVRARESRSKET